MQVPAYVEYEKATSVEHALALLARFGPEARILAGGHSLIPMMKLRLAQPETLIDINGLSELSLHQGDRRRAADRRADQARAAARRRRSPGEHFAILHDAERVIADPIVRNWGTVGGSLCQADPSEDLSAVFAALKATHGHPGPDGSQDRVGPGVPHRARTRPWWARRAADRDQDRDPAGRRQRLREGGAPGRRLADRRGRGGHLAGRGGPAASPTPGSASPRSAPSTSPPPRPRSSCAARRPPRRASPGPARSRPSTATRSPTSAAPPTTSGTWPASSPCGRCAGRCAGPGDQRATAAGTPDMQITVTVNGAELHRATSSRGCC